MILTKVQSSLCFTRLFGPAHLQTPKCPRRSRTWCLAQGAPNKVPPSPAQGSPARTRSAQGFSLPRWWQQQFGEQPYIYIYIYILFSCSNFCREACTLHTRFGVCLDSACPENTALANVCDIYSSRSRSSPFGFAQRSESAPWAPLGTPGRFELARFAGRFGFAGGLGWDARSRFLLAVTLPEPALVSH